jgi:prepilin-type processing-associated H-X9-DG protein
MVCADTVVEPKIMGIKLKQHPAAAFTLPELIVMIAIVFLVVVFVLPAIRPRRSARGRIKCVNNLKNVGLAFRIFATDNGDKFPFALSVTNGGTRELHASGDPFRTFQALSNEISTPKIVVCPNEKRPEATNWINFSNTNVSYFISPDASEDLPQSFLSGDHNILWKGINLGPGVRRFRKAEDLSWGPTIHTNQGNVCMGDGSVQQLSTARLREQFRNAGHETNFVTTFLMP